MIYLDYAANTPVEEEVLQTFCEITREYTANPNSPYPEGRRAKQYLEETTSQIAQMMNVKQEEIIYTSGATESNNLAIKGIAQQYKKFGKHIITTLLEHSSVTGPMAWLQNQGYEVEYVEITESGLVDLEHLKELLREDTILVSICCVDSELGIQQNIPGIAALLKDCPHCFFHTDASQAVGKIPVHCSCADLLTFTPHKFYGLNGCGVLIKKEGILLEPQLHGGISTTPFRSGTPVLPLIASTAKALSLALRNMDEKLEYVARLNQELRTALQKYKRIRINSTAESVPFILNISISGARAEDFQAALAEHEICVSTKSACCAPNTVSRPVYALTKDKKAALSTLRISLSHRTSLSHIEGFLACFDESYRKFVK
jgi:cysteine desulfurase